MITFLDLATRLTGWTTGDGRAIPDCDVWKLPQAGADLGWMLDVLDEYLRIHIERFRPVAIGYEAPILVPRRDNLIDIRKAYSMGGHVEFVCRKRDIPCHEISLRTVKNELTGNSFAAKDDMVAVARKVGMTLPPGPGAKDAADAFGGWLVMLRHYEPELSAAWDRRIWSSRGALL